MFHCIQFSGELMKSEAKKDDVKESENETQYTRIGRVEDFSQVENQCPVCGYFMQVPGGGNRYVCKRCNATYWVGVDSEDGTMYWEREEN